MNCEAHGATVPARDHSARSYGVPRKHAPMSQHQAQGPGPPVGMARRGPRRDPEEGRSEGLIGAPEAWCQSSPRLEARAELAPVAMAGSLVGSVEGPCGLLTQVRLLVRDPTHAVVRVCYPTGFRTEYSRVQFEVRGLPVDTYSLEVRAPGFCRELLHGVPVEATCITHVGVVRLTRVKQNPRGLAGRCTPPCWVRGVA